MSADCNLKAPLAFYFPIPRNLINLQDIAFIFDEPRTRVYNLRQLSLKVFCPFHILLAFTTLKSKTFQDPRPIIIFIVSAAKEFIMTSQNFNIVPLS